MQQNARKKFKARALLEIVAQAIVLTDEFLDDLSTFV